MTDPDSRIDRDRRALARCIREQRACRRWIEAGKPDAAGAWDGLCDWVMEETIIRSETGGTCNHKNKKTTNRS